MKHQSNFEPKYLVTLDEIYHSHWAALRKRRIAHLREAARHFWPKGHPSRLIHITGTNGKGSTAHYLTQGLRSVGNTGSWTGPHVFDYAERFHINGVPADHDEIVTVYREILEPYQHRFGEAHPGESLTFAEMGILLALHLFERHAVSWGVMEVGAGGRYTPLMGLEMTACVLTNVGYDHPKTLGDRLWQRALEKAGIARPGVPFFTAATGEALEYVRETAEAEGAEVRAVRDEELAAVADHLPEPQPGFKLRNLALACKLIRHFYSGLKLEALVRSMGGHLQARFHRVSARVVADVAHNADKVAALAEQLRLAFPGHRFRFIVGLTRSRDAREVFAPLAKLAGRVVVSAASYPGQPPESVAEKLRSLFPEVAVIAEPGEALAREQADLADDEVLVLTGSAYLIDQALNPNPYVRHLNASYGWRGEEPFGK